MTDVLDRPAVERLLRSWTEDAIAAGRLDLFDELLAPDAVDRSGPHPVVGVESFKSRTAAVRAAFAEIRITVDELVVDGDAVAWRWTLTGTHVGPFAGVAPTGRRVTLRGANFQRLKSGRVTEHWTIVDVFGATQGLRSG
jgi:steroid delta-isomerase-like uncharacterized protein